MQRTIVPIYDRLASREASLAVIGLGYVGLDVAVGFARHFNVVGYDIDSDRVENIRKKYGADNCNIRFSSSVDDLAGASFYVITVPTPVDDRKNPDLSPLLSATRTVARYLNPGDYVVYESTVYPGCTEQECVPQLEEVSGLKSGRDFKVGYSPERINPNDPLHSFENTFKVVSANDEEALENISNVYAEAVCAGVYKASGIKVAEASKMTENVQRNVNIALMNELQRVFSHMGIDMSEVIEAASTKWNFARYKPGLVGGHCISVDPHYLVSEASRSGVDVPIISLSCAVNDSMPAYVVRSALEVLGPARNNPRALLMGVTYKQNTDDIRNTRAADVFRLLEKESVSVDAVDPYADPDKFYGMYGIRLLPVPQPPYDLIIVTVPHDGYVGLDEDYFRSISNGNALLADIGGLYKGRIKSLKYWSL